MHKRPNPLSHMVSWGFILGIILAQSYLVVLLDVFSGANDPSALLFFLNPGAWWLALMFGAIPGAAMGVTVSAVLWGMMRDVDLPFTKDAMIAKRPQVYSINFLTTLALSLILMFIGFGSVVELGVLIFPPIIAAVASTYAAHRYLYRLRVWSSGTETRKEKAKNEAIDTARLEDRTQYVTESYRHDEQRKQEQEQEQYS